MTLSNIWKRAETKYMPAADAWIVCACWSGEGWYVTSAIWVATTGKFIFMRPAIEATKHVEFFCLQDDLTAGLEPPSEP